MRIGEVAKKSGIPASTLRYYEDFGLIPEPRRVNGQRDYNTQIFTILDTIQLAQDAGFTLREIRQLMDSRDIREQWKLMARIKLGDVQQTIRELRLMEEQLLQSLRCKCDSGDTCTYFPS